ncbi:protoheme IX farnesyltransferase [Fistulina hepatica ATCC 64428]|uniref:Protoheme IX farnesyltransferase, mitochondrial n=1 Tax=Fistulina hepatica ATCC 64428 TaxID=1128425 RepID=A0A0D7ACN5_9AGAR|nr:protoheme IX farnesyltransferase [Fistulina hepatica ATCC 64428]
MFVRSRPPILCARLLCLSQRPRCYSRHATFSSYFFNNQQWSTPVAPLDVTTHPPITAHKRRAPASLHGTLRIYAQLSKSRLSTLIVLTSMLGVALSPFPVSVPTLLATAAGTGFCSAAANTFNQIQEVPFDAQMARTRARPLVRRAVSPFHAAAFGTACTIAGPLLLATAVNPTTAALGAANIVLYAGVYTHMKRTSIWNTWVGSVVGGIPPLMGWTACGGHLFGAHGLDFSTLFLPFSSAPLDLSLIDNPLAPLALFSLLFSWQFPHFNPLAYIVRDSYAQAGYRMISVLDPKKNALVALRHAVLLTFPISTVLFPLSGLTTWAFAITSLVPNLYCLRQSWRFYKHGSEANARSLFHACIAYLPIIMGLMMFHKQGMDWSAWFKEKLGWTPEKEQSAESHERNN